MSTDWLRLFAELETAGWSRVDRGRCKHIVYRPPAGRPDWPAQLVFASTSGGGRGFRNARAQVRRLGI